MNKLELKKKKKVPGFSLFGFMNNKKNKSSKNSQITSQESNIENHLEKDEHDNEAVNNSDHFFNSNAMNDDKNLNSDPNDNIVNVPAFFRKKNK